MSTYPENRERRPHPLQWFALSIAGGFFLSFFVYWAFAALLALSLGAVATAFDQARQGPRVSTWLALPLTGVFAFVTGAFVQGFTYQAETNVRARIVTGAAEVVLMIFTGGDTPIEGVDRVSPWRHVAISWITLTAVAPLVGRCVERRRRPRA